MRVTHVGRKTQSLRRDSTGLSGTSGILDNGSYAPPSSPALILDSLADGGDSRWREAAHPLAPRRRALLVLDLHGAILGHGAPPVHPTLVRVLSTVCGSRPAQSTSHFLRQNSMALSVIVGPIRSGVAPSATRRSGAPSAPSHGSGPRQTILSLIA